jgi:hypothetical protein
MFGHNHKVLHELLRNATKTGSPAQFGERWIYLSVRGGLDLPTYEHLATAFVEEPIMRFKTTLEQMYDKAREEGMEKGIEQGKEHWTALRDIEHIESMRAKGFGWEQIASYSEGFRSEVSGAEKEFISTNRALNFP